MDILGFLLIMALLVGAIVVSIRYDPYIGCYEEDGKIHIILWYDKHDKGVCRTYIKLF